MNETRKLILWAGIMVAVTLGVFFGTLSLLPSADAAVVVAAVIAVVFAAAFAADVAGLTAVAATVAATVAAVVAAACATIGLAAFAGFTTGVAAAAFAAGVYISGDSGVSKKRAAGILITEALIIFGAMMTKIAPLL